MLLNDGRLPFKVDRISLLTFVIAIIHTVAVITKAWLCDVERGMRWTLQMLLKDCRLALKKAGTKREKWLKDWAGQVRVMKRRPTG